MARFLSQITLSFLSFVKGHGSRGRSNHDEDRDEDDEEDYNGEVRGGHTAGLRVVPGAVTFQNTEAMTKVRSVHIPVRHYLAGRIFTNDDIIR